MSSPTAHSSGEATGPPGAGGPAAGPVDAAADAAAQGGEPSAAPAGAEGASARAERRNDAWERLLHWLFFSVLLAVMPIGAGVLVDLTRKQNRPFFELISHGDLYIVSTGLTATAVGDALMRQKERFRPLQLVLAFTNIAICLLTCILYADIGAATQDGKELDHQFLGEMSLVFFAITLVTTGSSTFLNELEKQ
ncbi:hypothetical protein BLA24_26275 [Streptomyces cinnamoneus]|uniref:Uncharacterized protein n=1 Tax=Streptomyces cinnamoneus TaxID=53446 RepID=A0A2G1XE83_STRCJ|nr:hypothetical protein [Streptomyces cinnamoneus]PHQ49538.1 hypothetical protein BLA24_26275 [Streptomyces cinnamoneus]PPT14742.1 hypothetical protein CYQ11_19365 [Streptomyces cinnamoneus]